MKKIKDYLTQWDTTLRNSFSESKTALEEKNVEVAEGSKLSDIPTLIEQIDTGEKVELTITAPDYEGQKLTATKGEKQFTGHVTEGIAHIMVDEEGVWKVSADDGRFVEIETDMTFEVILKNTYIYGFTVDNDEPDPNKRVEYTDDAVGMTPAKMESTSFNWGDWKDVFFNEKNHVYRISGNGTVGKQVKDDNYAQFVDGGDSGINGSGHTDNFMSSIPTVWVYRGMEGNKRVVKISDKQVDDSYKAYAHTNESGEVLDFIYWPTFRGSLVNNVMRSISSQKLMGSKTAQQEVTYATANGNRWHTFDWADYQLRNDLLTLMFKTTDLQKALGRGYCDSNSATLDTGSLITKGAFWGDQTGKSEVKAFHCEAPWGNQYLRIAGCVITGAVMKVKMTRPYNTTGSGYTTVSPAAATSRGYMSAGTETEYGLIPTATSGAGNTYECDYFYNNTTDAYAYVGGNWYNTLDCGPWCLRVNSAASYADADVGSALCLK